MVALLLNIFFFQFICSKFVNSGLMSFFHENAIKCYRCPLSYFGVNYRLFEGTLEDSDLTINIDEIRPEEKLLLSLVILYRDRYNLPKMSVIGLFKPWSWHTRCVNHCMISFNLSLLLLLCDYQTLIQMITMTVAQINKPINIEIFTKSRSHGACTPSLCSVTQCNGELCFR